MSASTFISVNEYLTHGYRPDCDYVEGRIEERNAGEHDHAALQAALVLWFGQHQQEWNIEVLPEQRIQISPKRFRVPDVCLVSVSRDHSIPFTSAAIVPLATRAEIRSPTASCDASLIRSPLALNTKA